MNGDLVLALARSRHTVRHFKPDPIPEHELATIVEAARWAPSGFHLEPIHSIVITNEETRKQLEPVCFHQYQVLEAPALIVLAADRRADVHHLGRVIDGLKLSAAAEDRLRLIVRMNFEQGACGLVWLAKLLGGFLLHPFTRMPLFPAIHKRAWLAHQAGLACGNIVLAAEGFQLGTVSIENFDEARVRRILQIPRHFTVPAIIAVGYPQSHNPVQFRLPSEDMIHKEAW